MKQLALILALVSWGFMVSAQNVKVQTAINKIKPQYNELDEAKEAIDAAIVHEKTMNSPKAWKVRGDVYKAIAESQDEKFKALSDNPLVVAFESYKKALELDTKGSLKKEIDVQLKLMSFNFVNKGVEFFNAQNYDKALSCFEGSLGITELTAPGTVDTAIVFNAAIAAERAKNFAKAIEYYTKTTELRYEGAKVFVYLANIYKTQGDTAVYISTLEKGIAAWPSDNNLIMVELINYYLTSNKSDLALAYLEKAIAADASNPTFYFAQGSLFDKLGDFDKALASYNKAVELNPQYFDAYYNLGALFYNKAVEMTKAANDIPANKQKEYDQAIKNAMDQLNLAIPYFEKAHAIDPLEKNTMITLKEIYFKLRNDHPEYNDKYKELEEALKAVPQQ
jgi:tetratricopeptide (TPR) repeat protein